MNSPAPVVLTIAGFDPSGGAGIIADVKTIVQFCCRPVAAITSLTFQNAAGVFGATHETARSLRAQIVPIIAEHEIAAVKIGMIPTAQLVSEVGTLIRDKRLPAPVVDPVLRSSSGYELIEPDALEALRQELLPLALLVTPNIPEAETLTGVAISDEDGMREAARKLREMGARAALIKGGHLEKRSEVRDQGSEEKCAVDILDHEDQVTVFRGQWIEAEPVRGTGCMLSSAIAAGLANGQQLPRAIEKAKQFVAAEIQNSRFKTQNSLKTNLTQP